MSQASTFGTNSTPTVPTSFATDSGVATPVANVLTVTGAGGITTSASGSTVTITLTETTYSGSATTANATPTSIVTVTPTNLKSFSVQALVSGYDSVNDQSVGGELIWGGRKNGTVTIVGSPGSTLYSDAGLAAASFTIAASGADFVFNVTGVAGRSIAWKALLNVVQSP